MDNAYFMKKLFPRQKNLFIIFLPIVTFIWIVGWIFGAQSWFVDMNLANWTGYTLSTLLAILWRMLVNALGGALAGLIVALVYNAVAGIMGGIKLEVE